jgi:hypothetical protein
MLNIGTQVVRHTITFYCGPSMSPVTSTQPYPTQFPCIRKDRYILELSTNLLIFLWIWWSHAADVVPFWDPFGATLSLPAILALIGLGIKRILGRD